MFQLQPIPKHFGCIATFVAVILFITHTLNVQCLVSRVSEELVPGQMGLAEAGAGRASDLKQGFCPFVGGCK